MNTMVRRARAVPASSWALSRTPSKRLAELWGVSPSRARHKRADGENCLSDTCALIADPQMDGEAMLAACMEALERKYEEEAALNPRGFRERLDHLLYEAEHQAQAKQDRALMTMDNPAEACLDHARDLIEIAMRVRMMEWTG